MLRSILSEDEFRNIPDHVASKIEKTFSENSEQYINIKALYETCKRDHENEVRTYKDHARQEVEKYESFQLDYNRQCSELENLENKVKALEKQNLQLKNDVVCHGNEARTYRLQRDEIADEKLSLQAMLNRRTNELGQLKSDYDNLSVKLQTAVQAKIEAMSTLDEIQTKKVELDYKEKRLDQEKQLLTDQINFLTNDVTQHSKELVVLRREHTSQIIDLQNRLQHKDDEIRQLLENEENYRNQLKTLTDKIEELNARLSGQSEIEIKLQLKYVEEINSRTRLTDMYKEMSEDSNRKAEELAKTTKELQKLLSEASAQYDNLEQRFTVNETTYQEHLQQKNETIDALKRELFDANNLIDSLKQDRLSETLDTLSPHAAAAYSVIKKGLTLTQIYTEYASVSEQLLIKTHENEQLQNTFKAFIEELEGKAHILRKRNEDYAEAMETIERISRNYDQLEMDYNGAKERCTEAECNLSRLSREREKLQKTVSDLSRQVCFLLKEVEEAHGGEIIMKHVTDSDTSGLLNSSDIISKKLVTFRDIEELQQNNQKLLNVVRDLSEDYEQAEAKLQECNKEEMEEKIKRLENAVAEREETCARQEKKIQTLKSYMKVYQVMGAEVVGSKRMRIDDIDAVLDVNNLKQIEVQTDSVEIESLVVVELRKELAAKSKELAELKNEFETSTKDLTKEKFMHMDALKTAEKNYQKLSEDYKTIISRSECSEEKCKSMMLTVDSMKAEITALENRCRQYSQTIGKHEQTITSLREEAMSAMSALSRTEVLLENAKRDCSRLKESEARLAAERDVLKQDKQSHAYLLSNLESIKASIDRSESEWKLKMDEKLDSALKECSALRRRLQDEQDRYAEKLAFMEQTIETSRSRLEEEKKSSSELMNITNSLRLDLEEKNKAIEELKDKLKSASSKSVVELELLMKNLQNKYETALKDIEHQKELVIVAKKDADEFRELADSMEAKLMGERDVQLKYQRETEIKMAEMVGEMAVLRGQNDGLQKRVNELAGLNETSMVNLNDELQQERRKYAAIAGELANVKRQLVGAQNEMKAAVEAKLIAEKKYTDEMLQHTNDIKALQGKVDVILDLENRLVSVTAERDDALRKAESINTNWREEEMRIRQEIDVQNEKMKAVVQQNELLLNEIQELSLKMAVAQGRDSLEHSSIESTGDGSVDNLLQVISYLRREKNLANSQLEVMSAENRRLKSEVDLLKCQLEETRLQLKAEQDKTDISSTTAAKHAELINKVQTLNALADSNRVLREERDQYAAELAEFREKLSQIEAQTMAPLCDENKRLQLQVETFQTEVAGLNKECTMWRNRVTEMTEKMNKTNSDELKDLKKTLNKEREEYNKTLETLRSVKQEKTKLEEQIKKLQMPSPKLVSLEKERNELLKERNDLQKELNEAKTKLEKVGQEFGELQKTFIEQEAVTNKMKASNAQIKSIARRYKAQCNELTEQLKSMTNAETEAAETAAEPAAPGDVEIPVAEQNRLRLEERQKMEAEMNDRVKALTDQLTVSQTKIEKLMADNEALQETVAEKEVRAADILQQARCRIQNLAKAGKKHQKEAESYKERIETIENATREECVARENVIKSSYENRIAKMEKEKTDLQADRDRLAREVEVISQRVNALQRQLHTQQGVKSNVNSSQEKSTTEPPTANIKPMAGPSSSGTIIVTKSQQSQQSVAVTPWRSANETPLASIRPMSVQTRTAAVLPTSQTSCSTSQSTVMVPPQQQLVDTSSNAPSIVEAFSSSPSSSSHTDYNMPSTSSSVSHPPVRQVVVTPTQQTSHSAESTQDMEAECGNQELASQDSLSGQQQPQSLQNQPNTSLLTSFSQSLAGAPTVSQSQLPTVALVLPRIDLQNVSTAGPSSHLSNAPEQSVVASSQTTVAPLVSASNQTDTSSSSSSTPKRADASYYQPEMSEDSNLGQVSASNQHGQQQAVVASSIETAPEQSIVIASSQTSYDKSLAESSVASSLANSSNTVTTTQAGLKRTREMEGESSKSGGSTETGSAQPQAKRSRRMEQILDDVFRNDVDETSNADMLLRYSGLDVEYQVPTSSQRDQEFDNLVIDSEAEDELEEDEQAMPDDGIIDENDDGQEYVEDEEDVESEEVYQIEEGYDGEEQDTTMTSYNEGHDIDEEGVQVQDQDNEAEIMDEESNEVPNQSGRSDSTALIAGRRNLEQQTSEATSSGNNLRAQSTSITSNQSPISLQFSRRPSTISPLNRQQNQQLLLSQYEENTGDDSIVPSTPTLCVPRRTDGFGEAVSSPHVPSAGRFTFSESNPPTTRAGVAQMISEGIDDTRMDLSQLEENSGTGRSVPSTPLQSSPQDIERIEVGQSVEDGQQLNEELSSNTNQPQPVSEDILIDTDTFRGESADNDLEVVNESEDLMGEPSDAGRDENADVTSDGGPNEPSGAGVSQPRTDEPEEGREAEAATKTSSEPRPSPQPIPTTNQTARRGGRMGRPRGTRSAMWSGNQGRNRNVNDQAGQDIDNVGGGNRRGGFRDRGRKQNKWYSFKRY